jgi:hypothetical protein
MILLSKENELLKNELNQLKNEGFFSNLDTLDRVVCLFGLGFLL